MEYFLLIIAALIGLYIIALPVKFAGAAMGAQRTGVVWCLLALTGSSIMHALGLAVPCIGSIVAFVLSAIAFAVIMGTDILRGIGIEILVIIFSAILLGCVSLGFGVSLTGLLEMLGQYGLPVSF